MNTTAIFFLSLAVSINFIVGVLAMRLPKASQDFGLTIPTVVALYEDSLQSRISSTATSMTLARGTDKQSRNLSGTFGFIIDEGGADEEFVIATCAATACTSMTRGIDVIDGKTEVTALKKEHRRGASVKVTNFPQLAILSRILNGDEKFPNIIGYQQQPTFSSTTDVVTKQYVDSSVNQGAATSTESVGGIAELATQIEMASSTDLGVNRPLVLQAKYATSTPSALRIAGSNFLYVPITENDGYLSQSWLDLTENFTFSGTVNVTGSLQKNGYNVLPPGTIQMYAATTTPTGWLLADGSAVSRTTYSALFAVIGDKYGVGDGSTTFNLPNLKGKFVFGTDASQTIFDMVGESGGATSTTLTVSEMPAHSHDIPLRDTAGGANTVSSAQAAGGSWTGSTASAGGGNSFSRLNPYMVMQYIIKY